MLSTLYQLYPPLFALGLLRVDNPSSHIKDLYAQDRQFFALNRKRNLYIRASYLDEFDMGMDMRDLIEVPRLHVLVNQLQPGFHQITPLYRGKSFFYGNDNSDLEVIEIVSECARRKGIDAVEWVAYEQKRSECTKATIEVIQ